MALPSNFQKKVNLPNRIKALNDLVFYTFKYKLNLTEEAVNIIYDNIGDKNLASFEEFVGSISLTKKGEAFGEKKFSAINRDIANNKWKEWLNKAKEMGIILGHEILDVSEHSLMEELEKTSIIDVLDI